MIKHFLILLVLVVSQKVLVGATNAPVILIPGLAGSVLEEKLNRSSTPSFYCTKTSDWQVVWLSLTAASRPDCLLDDLHVDYNKTSHRYQNQTGVEIRAYQFGNLSGIAALDPSLPSVSGTYEKLINGLKDAGYEEGKDIFGAPYDFRLAADGLEQVGFFGALTSLLESAVDKNDGKPAVIVAHSMGCLVSTYFLARKDTDWLKKHIASFIAVSAPFEGAVTALKGSISGDNFDAPVIPHDLLRPLQSTVPSGPWLFPTPDVWGNEVLVSTTGGDNYTAGDALQILQDLNLTQQATVYPWVHNLTYPLPRLDLPVHCLYGVDVHTETGFEYDIPHFNGSVKPPAPSKIRSGDGDGTVNLRSLEACSRLGDDVTLQSFEKASHLGLLKDDRAVRVIVHLLSLHGGAKDARSSWLARAMDWARGWSRVEEDAHVARRQLTDRQDAYTLRHPSTLPEVGAEQL
jgi:lysophospholipase-3